MAKKTIDDESLEKYINQYMITGMPLSILLDTYDLSTSQMQILINRMNDYETQIIDLNKTYPVSPDVENQTVNSIPYVLRTKTPAEKAIQEAQFRRLAALKQQIANAPQVSLFSARRDEIKAKEDKLATYDLSVIKEVEEFLNNYGLTDASEEEINNILKSNDFTSQDITDLKKYYREFKALQQEILVAKKNMAEDEELARQARRVNIEYSKLMNQMVYQNCELVIWCIGTFFSGIPFPMEDAINLGNEGLFTAINTYNQTLDIDFSFYAISMINDHIKNHFNELLGLSWEDYKVQKRIEFARDTILNKNSGRINISPEELAKVSSMPYSARTIAKNDSLIRTMPMTDAYSQSETEFDTAHLTELPSTEEDYNALDTYEDMVSALSEEDIDEIVASDLLKDALKNILSELTDKEKTVIVARFGLDGSKPKTLEEVGGMLGLSKPRIKQIEFATIKKLREADKEKLRGFFVPSSYWGLSREPVYSTYTIYSYLITLLNNRLSISGVLTFLQMRYGIKWSDKQLEEAINNLNNLSEFIHRCVNRNIKMDEIIDRINRNENDIYEGFFGRPHTPYSESFSVDFAQKVMTDYKAINYSELKMLPDKKM